MFHSWGRQLQHHPQEKRLITPKKDDFLVHFRPLAERFRNLMRQVLQNEHSEIFQNLSLAAKKSLQPQTTWNVQLQHVGSGRTAVRYLARYVRRSAIGPKRLIGYDKQGRVKLYWTSSSTGKTAIMALHPHELIRRWLIHVLPNGFARARHYGFMSSAATRKMQTIRLHLGADPKPEPQLPEARPHTCPCCGGNLTFLRELAPVRLMRGPPKKRKEQAA
ncbi:MAG: transposase [Akkermansiaceae bacterium]